MKTVRIAASAASYLKREAAYLRRHTPTTAERFLSEIREARMTLARFPHLGRSMEEPASEGLRRLVVGDYLLDYRCVGEEVRILSVRHGRQDHLPAVDDPVP